MPRQSTGLLDSLAALPALLPHLPLGDVLQLSRTCQTLRAAVVAAWRPRKTRVLLTASLSNKLVLLNPFAPEPGAAVLRECSTSLARAGPAAVADHEGEEGEEDDGGPWAPCLDVDAERGRAYVSQYQTGCVLEFALPSLQLLRRFDSLKMQSPNGLPGPLRRPEGIVVAHQTLYVAWLQSLEITAAPLEWLDWHTACERLHGEDTTGAARAGPAAAAGAAGAAAGAASRAAAGPAAAEFPTRLRRHTYSTVPRPNWIVWGMRAGPDGALYAAVNPAYPTPARYGQLPGKRHQGKGFVARLAVNSDGELEGKLKRFTVGSHLSRPSGLCFDAAGDLYVTHMGCEVVKFGGPHRGKEAGKRLGVFIDTKLPEHGLTPNTRSYRPCPMDIAFHEGLFFLTTHTSVETDGVPSHGCLSVWEQTGRLLAKVHLGEGFRHPNGLAAFTEAG